MVKSLSSEYIVPSRTINNPVKYYRSNIPLILIKLPTIYTSLKRCNRKKDMVKCEVRFGNVFRRFWQGSYTEILIIKILYIGETYSITEVFNGFISVLFYLDAIFLFNYTESFVPQVYKSNVYMKHEDCYLILDLPITSWNSFNSHDVHRN